MVSSTEANELTVWCIADELLEVAMPGQDSQLQSSQLLSRR